MRYEKGSFIVVPNQKKLVGMKASIQSVYLWLCFHSNQEGICFPSLNTIAKESGVSRRGVIFAIQTLEASKMIEKTARKIGKENLSNIYALIIEEGQYLGGGSAMGAPPSVENAPTPSVEKATVTVSNINYNPVNSIDVENSFNKFWDAYNKKVGKVKSFEIWKQKRLTNKVDEILQFIKKAQETDRWKGGFKKDPERFLRLESWQDDISSYAGFKTQEVGMKINKY